MTQRSESRQRGLCLALALGCLSRQDSSDRQADGGRITLTGPARFEEFTKLLADDPVGQLPLLELDKNARTHTHTWLHCSTLTHMLRDSGLLVCSGRNRKYCTDTAMSYEGHRGPGLSLESYKSFKTTSKCGRKIRGRLVIFQLIVMSTEIRNPNMRPLIT